MSKEMFKQLSRTDRALPPEKIQEIMGKAEYGVLSTTSENGYPYGVPVSFVFHDNHIYFHCAQKGHKLENIAHNAKVSFCVVADVILLSEKFATKYSSVISFGTASEVSDPTKKQEILVKLLEKFSPDFMKAGMKYIAADSVKAKVYQIEVEHISAKGRL